MSVLLVCAAAMIVVGVVAVIASRRARARSRATPPWEAWKRGEYYLDDQIRRDRRTRALLGGILGVVIAIPVMILAGFSGTAKRTIPRH
jgi:hypothetical protein